MLPSAAGLRFILPEGRSAAAAAFRTRTSARGRTEQLRNAAVSAALRVGAGRLVVRDYLVPDPHVGSLVDHLAEVLGQDLVAGVHFGPPRANRKPVLSLLAPDGRAIAYAKVGGNALTDRLVAHESTALRSLDGGGLGAVRVPEVLHTGEWQGRQLLVMSPLALPRRPRRPDPGLLAAGVKAVAATADGGDRDVPELTAALREQAVAAAAASETALVVDLLDLLDSRFGALRLPTGAWHGDFAGGNVVADGGHVLWVLDWERYDTRPTAVGSDLLHYLLRHEADTRGRGMVEATRFLAGCAGDALGGLGLSREQAHATSGLYLATLSLRYLCDGQAGPGTRLGSVAPWVETVRSVIDGGGN
jgi:hypothetical protein